MIYTLTFNPSIDYYLKVEDFKIGKLNRTKETYKYPGGKGINVSRVLKRLGKESKALGFIGGFTGEYIKEFLKKEGIYTDFINISEDSRINVKVQGNGETEINAEGPNISKEDLNRLFKQIENLNKEDILILSGSIQRNLNKDIYAQIQKRAIKNGVKVIVDTTGEALLLTLKNNPFLIKPNNSELGQMFNADIEGQEDIIYYGRKLRELGAENVIVSIGEDGAILICKEGVYRAKVPCGKMINSVGAGDSLIGGFTFKYLEELDVLEAFKFGVACGSVTAFSMDLCVKEDVDILLERIDVEKIF